MTGKFYIGVTDSRWFHYLAALGPDGVNCWMPGGSGFKAVPEAGLFLLKLKSPNNFIIGGGFFVRHTRRLVSLTCDMCCAVSRLPLINGVDQPEVQAAQIIPVEHNSPGCVRSGIALAGKVYRLFDRGLTSFGDDGSISGHRLSLPAEMGRLIRPERQ